MTDIELNKFIHEVLTVTKVVLCRCGCEKYVSGAYQLPNYLEHNRHWAGLFNWAKEQPWWPELVNEIYLNSTRSWELVEALVANPRSLAEYIAEHLK
ncbi:MAG: hypothetical protein KAR06_08860 [Deltaproteobacteria bacterium]|nr:hypothetical protein [Deltaproteobacteria bacterium]